MNMLSHTIIQANECELTFRKDCGKEQTANEISEKDCTIVCSVSE